MAVGFVRDEQGFITEESMTEFYRWWTQEVGPDLLGGYGVLVPRSEMSDAE